MKRHTLEEQNENGQLTSSMLSDFRTNTSKPKSLEKTKEVCNAGEKKKQKQKTSKWAAKVLHKCTLKVMLVSQFSLISDKGKRETLDNVPQW